MGRPPSPASVYQLRSEEGRRDRSSPRHLQVPLVHHQREPSLLTLAKRTLRLLLVRSRPSAYPNDELLPSELIPPFGDHH